MKGLHVSLGEVAGREGIVLLHSNRISLRAVATSVGSMSKLNQTQHSKVGQKSAFVKLSGPSLSLCFFSCQNRVVVDQVAP